VPDLYTAEALDEASEAVETDLDGKLKLNCRKDGYYAKR